ncbi:MAG: YcaQ family DNA glycosylase [Anaerolineales bacterium]|nr:YcaQ family DNA glycosylase [Anaerolineales bacterium]
MQTLTIDKAQARRFLLAHHMLWPPRRLKGKPGALDYVQRVGCIQFDTINVVTRNADLVLQSRLAGYRPELLASLLYQERSLWDGWDKMQSIYLSTDWPHFQPRRERMRANYGPQTRKGGRLGVAAQVLEAIRARGPLSSLDIEHSEKLEDWSWGQQTRAARASMEVLYAMGDLGIHSRVNTRRVFDLVERLLPGDLRTAPHPHPDLDAYHDWHVLRRIGGLGLAVNRGTEHWLGISHLKSPARHAAIRHLLDRGEALAVEIKGLESWPIYMRRADLPTLEAVGRGRQPAPQAAFIAPLDNFIWQRHLLEALFDFYYRWEVYVPPAKRQYGYYVLPVLYGDRFVARLDPAFERSSKTFVIQNWWWEAGVGKKDTALSAALGECIRSFARYLGAEDIRLGDAIRRDTVLRAALQAA